MRVDDVCDLRLLELGELEVALEILGLGVYDRRRAVAYSAEHVGRAPGLGVEELLEDHGAPPGLDRRLGVRRPGLSGLP